MLYSIATAFKTLLRPSDMSNHDKGPAESLAGILMAYLLSIFCIMVITY